MGKRFEELFSAKRYRMGNEHIKIYAASLGIRKMQSKTTMRCQYKPLRMLQMVKSLPAMQEI